MARAKGSMALRQNIEPAVRGPLDARCAVKTVADLIDAKSYTKTTIYVGMIVSITDTGEVYVLQNTNFTEPESWIKVALGDISANNIIRLPDTTSLPDAGEINKAYVVKSGTTGGDNPKDTYDIHLWVDEVRTLKDTYEGDPAEATDEDYDVTPGHYIKLTEGFAKEKDISIATPEEITALCESIFGA